MTTIGVGKAMRDQAREGRRARARREERVEDRRARTREAEWEVVDVERTRCAGCGCEDELADMYTGSFGLVCAPCFARGDGEISGPEVPSLQATMLAPLGYIPLLFAPHLLWLAGYGSALASGSSWWLSLIFLLWLCVVGGGMAGAPMLALFWAERLKEAWKRPDIEGPERAVLVGGLAWQAVSLPTMLIVAVSTASLLV